MTVVIKCTRGKGFALVPAGEESSAGAAPASGRLSYGLPGAPELVRCARVGLLRAHARHANQAHLPTHNEELALQSMAGLMLHGGAPVLV